LEYIISQNLKSKLQVFADFFDWCLKKSYFTTPGIYFFGSLLAFFIFTDSGNYLWLIFSFLLGYISFFLNDNPVFKIFVIIVWILLIIFITSFYIGPQTRQHISLAELCGVVQNIDKNDINLIFVNFDNKHFTRTVVIRNVDTRLLKLHSFEYICFKNLDHVTRSTGFSYAISFQDKYETTSQENFISLAVYKIRSLINETMEKYYAGRSGILSAILFGVRDQISPEDKKLFNQLGLGHVLVASGANIVMVLLVIKYIFEKGLISILKNKFIRNGFYLITITTYLLVVGLEGSLTRAFVFWIFFNLESIVGRKLHPLGKMSLVALCMLFASPSLVFSFSFILSITAVWALMMYSDLIQLLDISEESLLSNLLSAVLVVGLTGVVSGYFFKSVNLTGVISNILFFPILEIIVVCGFTISIVMLFVEIFGLTMLEGIVFFLSKILLFMTDMLYELLVYFNNLLGKSFIIKTDLFNNNTIVFVLLGLLSAWFVINFLQYQKIRQSMNLSK
jgi:ComEC/Rec2-related protein